MSPSRCHGQQEIGTLAPGHQADLLVVEGAPARDIAALERPVAVMQAGRLVRRPADGSP
jgi:imidazolonepropionase-like amidohydrolase